MRFGGRETGFKARYIHPNLSIAVEIEGDANDDAEGEALAHSFNCKFIETSAKSRINVDNAFYDIVREIRRYNKEMAGYTAGGSGNSGNGGPKTEFDTERGDKDRGCCNCVIM